MRVRSIPKPVVIPKNDDKYAQLNCHTGDNGEIIVVSYVGEDNQIGQIKYTFVQDAENWLASILKTDLERSLNLVKRDGEQEGIPGTMIYLLSPLSDNGDKVLDANVLLLLSPDIKLQPVDQKAYYEALGFTCSISEL